MTETVKRGRGRPKKVVDTTVQTTQKTEQITMEDIKREMEQIVNQRLAEEGIKPKVEQPYSIQNEEPTDEESDVYTTDVPMIWNGFYNILTRMFERDGEDFEIVKYNATKNSILVSLDEKHYTTVEEEIHKIKVVSCYHTLNYSGKVENGKILITISM